MKEVDIDLRNRLIKIAGTNVLTGENKNIEALCKAVSYLSTQLNAIGNHVKMRYPEELQYIHEIKLNTLKILED